MKMLLCVLFFPLLAKSQSPLSGKIIDAISKAAVPYATIGSVRHNEGVNANANGIFSINNLHFENSDTLIISSVGYQSLKTTVADVLRNPSIEMSRKENLLEDLTVFTKTKWETETVGKYEDCGDYGLSTIGFQTQAAKLFKTNHNNAILTSVNICVHPGIFPKEESTFRFRFYNKDSITGSPSTELCDSVIEVPSKKKTITINVEKYRIWIPGNSFFVAVEWLKIPENEYKYSNDPRSDEHYRPRIGSRSVLDNKRETWMLTYKNIWVPMAVQVLSIATTIKY